MARHTVGWAKRRGSAACPPPTCSDLTAWWARAASRRFAQPIRFAIGAVFVLALIAPLAAHEHATGVVRQRMDAMKEMATAIKAIDRRVKSGRDLAQVRADAERIHRLAETMTVAFPRGSGHHPSEAKPAVWKNWADFEDKARQLAAESGALARVDPQDAAAIASQTKRVTQSCGGCHEIYRSKKR